jgi:hypothetical protein
VSENLAGFFSRWMNGCFFLIKSVLLLNSRGGKLTVETGFKFVIIKSKLFPLPVNVNPAGVFEVW